MNYLHEIAAGHIEWYLAVSLVVGALPDRFLLSLIRGFGRHGFGLGHRRGFGHGLGPFRLFRLFRLVRIVFVLLFTTVLGPIVLVLIVVLLAYGIYNNRRR